MPRRKNGGKSARAGDRREAAARAFPVHERAPEEARANLAELLEMLRVAYVAAGGEDLAVSPAARALGITPTPEALERRRKFLAAQRRAALGPTGEYGVNR